VDGPGVRCVVFAQGCPHRCPGCHNPETWDITGGQERTAREIMRAIRKLPKGVSGVTFSGGEPFLQAGEVAELTVKCKEIGLNVATYTGYRYEELLKLSKTNPDAALLLENTDILIDGPYDKERKDISLRFRGSNNQKIIDMKASLLANQVVTLQDQ